MSNHTTKCLCYAAMMIIIAIDWAYIGAGLFLVLMDAVEGSRTGTLTSKLNTNTANVTVRERS